MITFVGAVFLYVTVHISEANINEAVGVWQAAPLSQFSLEQEPLSGSF